MLEHARVRNESTPVCLRKQRMLRSEQLKMSELRNSGNVAGCFHRRSQCRPDTSRRRQVVAIEVAAGERVEGRGSRAWRPGRSQDACGNRHRRPKTGGSGGGVSQRVDGEIRPGGGGSREVVGKTVQRRRARTRAGRVVGARRRRGVRSSGLVPVSYTHLTLPTILRV